MTWFYKNISYLFAGVLLFAFIAFYRTYFGLFPSFGGTTWVVHFHASVIILWFVLLIIQPVLIRKKRPDLHALIGKISYFLVPLIVLSFILIIRQTELKGKNLLVFAIAIINGSTFIIFYLLAIYYRKKTLWHIRFMVLTVIPFIDPAAGRLHIPGPLLQLPLILILLAIERFGNRVYKPYLVGLAVWLIILITIAYLAFFNQSALDIIWNVFFKPTKSG